MSDKKHKVEDYSPFVETFDWHVTDEEWERIREDIRSRCTKIETPHGTIWLHPSPNLTQRRELSPN